MMNPITTCREPKVKIFNPIFKKINVGNITTTGRRLDRENQNEHILEVKKKKRKKCHLE